MSFTVGIPNFDGSYFDGQWSDLLELAVEAERAGVDRVSLFDHVVNGSQTDSYPYGGFPGAPETPWLEPLSTLAAISGRTTTLRLGTAVLIAPLRPAAVLAKTAATIDAISGGRLDLGVGTGWQAKEYEAAGVDFTSRGQLLTETLAACLQLWQPGPVSFDSPTLRFDDVYCSPLPVQPGGVPFWVGGKLTKRNLDRIVRFGTGWIPAPTDDPATVRAGITKLHEALAEAGRDPAAVRVRVSPKPVRNDAGAIDMDASLATVAELLEHGATDVFLALNAWCQQRDEAPEFMTDMAKAVHTLQG